jgi:hypothetical protein
MVEKVGKSNNGIVQEVIRLRCFRKHKLKDSKGKRRRRRSAKTHSCPQKAQEKLTLNYSENECFVKATYLSIGTVNNIIKVEGIFSRPKISNKF